MLDVDPGPSSPSASTSVRTETFLVTSTNHFVSKAFKTNCTTFQTLMIEYHREVDAEGLDRLVSDHTLFRLISSQPKVQMFINPM